MRVNARGRRKLLAVAAAGALALTAAGCGGDDGGGGGGEGLVPLFVFDPALWDPAGGPRRAWLLRPT